MRTCRRSHRRPNAGRSDSTRRPVPWCQRPDEEYKCWHSHYHPDKHTHHWLKFTFRKEKITFKKRHRSLLHLRLETSEHATDPSSAFISETKLTAGRPVPLCPVLYRPAEQVCQTRGPHTKRGPSKPKCGRQQSFTLPENGSTFFWSFFIPSLFLYVISKRLKRRAPTVTAPGRKKRNTKNVVLPHFFRLYSFLIFLE